VGRTNTGPRYWASRKGYFVTLHGQQIRLANGLKDDPRSIEEAGRKFDVLMKAGRTYGVNGPTMTELVQQYRLAGDGGCPAGRNDIRLLWRFCQDHGDQPAWEVAETLVEKHVTARGWSPSGRTAFVKAVKRLMNWAVENGLALTNQFSNLRGAKGRSRITKPEDYITDVMFRKLYDFAGGPVQDLLTALDQTGGRPAEVMCLKASDYDRERKVLLPTFRKNGHLEGDGRKRRFLIVTPALEPIIERLCEQFPEGQLFRTIDGRPWDDVMLTTWLKAAAFELGLAGKYSSYGFRHRWITEYLLQNGPIGPLIELADATMDVIERHYYHGHFFTDGLHHDVERISRGERIERAVTHPVLKLLLVLPSS
jgi:site-specific recombinase XerD